MAKVFHSTDMFELSESRGSADKEEKDDANDLLEELKHEWRQEQHRVAAQVVIVPDECVDTHEEKHPKVDSESSVMRSLAFGENQQFQFIPMASYDEIQGRSVINPHYFGGVDVTFPKEENGKEEGSSMAIAAYGIVDLRSQTVVYKDVERYHVTVPYIPSYLAFRELEPLVALIERQKSKRPELTPRAILVDGNGVFHERFAGLACFVGLRTQIPTIGVGKTCSSVHGITVSQVNHELEVTLQELVKETDQNEVAQQLSELQRIGGDGIIFRRGLPSKEHIPKEVDRCTTSPSSLSAVATPGVKDVQHDEKLDRGPLVQALTPRFCNGIAVPIISPGSGRTLACALVGHGGKRDHRSNRSDDVNKDATDTNATVQASGKSGTKNPIFISVGHNISLQEAVVIASRCCIHARIPEPVRLADAMGRELLRQRDDLKARQSTR